MSTIADIIVRVIIPQINHLNESKEEEIKDETPENVCLGEANEPRINQVKSKLITNPYTSAPVVTISKEEARKSTDTLPDRVNRKLQETFGLAWTQSDYDDIKEVVFRPEDFDSETSAYASFQESINIHATCLLLQTCNKVLEEVNGDLDAILGELTSAQEV